MNKLIYHIAKFILSRYHGKNALITYSLDPWHELPVSRRLMAAMLKDGKV